MSRMCIVPPYVLSALLANLNPDTTEDDREIAEWVRRTLSGRLDKGTLATTISRPGVSSTAPPSISEAVDRTISTADDTDTLPGGRVRGEGDPESSDPAVDEAYTGLGATWQLYHDAFARNSIDGKGLPLLATVHYEHSYDNAFFDGTQMVFGDGDGRYFNRFTKPLDVVGHELSHGVVAATADLVYQGQSGALNESMADCFGSMVKQYDLGQTAEEADWIIGAGLFTAAVNGVGLRSMKAPGTAFDDPARSQRPAAGLDGRLRRDHRRRWRCAPQLRHPQPGVLPRLGGHRRQHLGRRRQGLVRSPPRRQRCRRRRSSPTSRA